MAFLGEEINDALEAELVRVRARLDLEDSARARPEAAPEARAVEASAAPGSALELASLRGDPSGPARSPNSAERRYDAPAVGAPVAPTTAKRAFDEGGASGGGAGAHRPSKAARTRRHPTSRFFGVSRFAANGAWKAHYHDEGGNDVHLGYFDDEEEAAAAYNAAIAASGVLRRKTNPVGADGRLRAKPALSSPYLGVFWDKGNMRWVAKVTRSKVAGLDGKQHKLGYFPTELLAALAVDEYFRYHMPSIAPRKTNFPTAEELRACGSDRHAAAAAAVATTTVVFPDATLGIRLELDEREQRIVFDRATAPETSPAADLPRGVVLSRINGALLGPVPCRVAYDATIRYIRGAPRPLSLVFLAIA